MTTSFARKALLGTAIAASMGIGYAIGAQPHMTASIGLLQSARAELGAATPNKGGHREQRDEADRPRDRRGPRRHRLRRPLRAGVLLNRSGEIS